MRFLRITLSLGYLMFGLGLLSEVLEQMAINAWIDLFPIEETHPTELTIEETEDKRLIVHYQFQIGDEILSNKRSAGKKVINERLNQDRLKVIICYNEYFPSVNYIKDLRLESVGSIFIMCGFGFIIIIFLLIDLFADKRKWLKLYGIPE
jgi:hypothetical protein